MARQELRHSGGDGGGLSFPVFVLRLSLAYLGSFLAAGTLGSWSSFADLLTRAGVFSDPSCVGVPVGKCVSQNERLQLLYYVAMAFQNVFAIPSGMLFDHQGPRVTGMIGLVSATVGLVGVFLALEFKAFEPALWVFVPCSMLGQNIGSWGVFGFIFYYKRHVGLLTGVCNSSFLLSSVQMYVLVAMVARGVALRLSVLYLLGSSVLASCVSFFAVPTMAEYQLSFCNAFGHHPQSPRSFWVIFRQLFRVFGLRPWQTLAYFAASAATNISFAFWMGSVYQFNSFNIGEALSDTLAADSAILYAVIGVLASPLTGFVFDKTGVLWYSVMFMIVQAAATAAIWPALFAMQMTVSIAMFVLYSLWLTFESKCPAVFAPPDLYGSFLGFSNSLTGLLQLALNLVIPVAIGSSLTGKWFYLVPILALMVTGVVCLLLFVVSLIMSPAPEVPPVLEEAKGEKLLVNEQ